jgi:capsular exopolysaccharide synthesis family protein
MSRIFDALRRSESERAGSDFEELPKGPDLLRHAERRVASRWQDAPLDREAEFREPVEGDEFSRRNGVPPGADAGEMARDGSSLPEAERLEIINRFPSLPIEPPSLSRVVCLTDKENPTAEAVRLLAVRLRDLRRTRPLKKILITSTIPQEGKSTISGNLACALAQASSDRILMVDGDLRRPSLSQMFGIHKAEGLGDWLKGDGDSLANIFHLNDAGFWMLPAGSPLRNPLELLQSPRLPVLVAKLAACFDWIIIDSPPVLPLADTSVWMRLADGILLVTRQGTTEKKQLQKGLSAIDSQKLLGALLNGTLASAYSGYYYRSSPPS